VTLIVCKVCGTDNEAGAQFCGNCGSFLEWTGESTQPEPPPEPRPQPDPGPLPDQDRTIVAPQPDGIVCPSCGTLNDRDRVYCRHCATELAPVPVPMPPEPVPGRDGPPRIYLAIAVVAAVVVIGTLFVVGGLLGGDGNAAVASPTPIPPASAAPTASPTIAPSPTPTVPPTPTPRPDPTGTLAWSSGTSGERDIVTSGPDGSDVTRVVKIAGDDVQAAWSPDGDQIAFASAKGIRIVDADGGRAKLITDQGTRDRAPDWSPDGDVIVFASRRDGDFDLYLLTIGETDVVRLTNNEAAEDDPAWSPVTDLIAFSSDREGDRDIWTMRPDGSGLTQLTSGEGDDDHPAWSPDGTTIAFTSEREGTTFIHLMDADGSNVRRLSQGSDPERHPAWSPDGLYIAYRIAPGDSTRIVVVSVEDGVEYANFAEKGKLAAYPIWH
jgi:TolB protein